MFHKDVFVVFPAKNKMFWEKKVISAIFTGKL